MLWETAVNIPNRNFRFFTVYYYKEAYSYDMLLSSVNGL